MVNASTIFSLMKYNEARKKNRYRKNDDKFKKRTNSKSKIIMYILLGLVLSAILYFIITKYCLKK